MRIVPREGWLVRRNRKPKRAVGDGEVTEGFLKWEEVIEVR